jgi:hypothetical protein
MTSDDVRQYIDTVVQMEGDYPDEVLLHPDDFREVAKDLGIILPGNVGIWVGGVPVKADQKQLTRGWIDHRTHKGGPVGSLSAPGPGVVKGTWQPSGSVAKIEWDLPKLERVAKWPPPRCECGSEAVGSNRHSSYCPKALPF